MVGRRHGEDHGNALQPACTNSIAATGYGQDARILQQWILIQAPELTSLGIKQENAATHGAYPDMMIDILVETGDISPGI